MSKKKKGQRNIKRKPKSKKKTAFSKDVETQEPVPQDVPIGMPMGMGQLKEMKEEATKMDEPDRTEQVDDEKDPVQDGTDTPED